MTMTMDQRNNHLGSSMGFDHMSYSSNGPQFNNPWSSGSSRHHTQLFPTSMGSNTTSYGQLKQEPTRASTASMPYSSTPASAPSMSATTNYSNYGQNNLLDMSQDLLAHRPTYEQGYSTAPSSVSSYAPTSAPYVDAYGTVAQSQPQDEVRRLSHS